MRHVRSCTIALVERVNSTAARAMRLLLADQPLTEAKVRFVWTMIAGPAVSRASTVTFVDGVLAIRTRTEAWQAAVERARPAMLARLAEFLGPGVVRSLSVTCAEPTRRTLHHRP
jgi:hypothetical protein